MARNVDKHGFWPLIFGIDRLENSKFQMLTPKDEFSCNAQGSIWDTFRSINNDVLNDVSKIIKGNPGCQNLVKCEILSALPISIKKYEFLCLTR